MNKSLAEQLEEAFDKAEEVEEGIEEIEAEAVEEPEDIPEETEAEAEVEEEEEEDDGEIEAEAEEEAEEEPETPQTKPPVDWTPTLREKWNGLDADVREQILKRDKEVDRVLQESADARREYDAFQKAMQPYQNVIAIEAGGNAVNAASAVLGVAARLRYGTPQEKATTVRQLIDSYGVDVQLLDNTWGENGTPQQYAPDPRVDQFERYMQMQQQGEAQRAQQEVERFLSEQEFGNDVRVQMADIMAVRQQRGAPVTLQEAYDLAVAMSPEIQQVIKSREQVQTSADETARVQRKKRAAKSVSGSPRGDSTPDANKTVRGALEAAWGDN